MRQFCRSETVSEGAFTAMCRQAFRQNRRHPRFCVILKCTPRLGGGLFFWLRSYLPFFHLISKNIFKKTKYTSLNFNSLNFSGICPSLYLPRGACRSRDDTLTFAEIDAWWTKDAAVPRSVATLRRREASTCWRIHDQVCHHDMSCK